MLRAVVAHAPQSPLRTAGRWFTKGPRRRRMYVRITRSVRPSAPSAIAHGPMRGLVFAGGETAGYALGASEPAVQQALVANLRSGDVFYDVGANAGFLSLLGAKLVGPTGRVYSFEPLPSLIPILRENLDRNGFCNHRVIEAAVGERSGTARLMADRGELRAALTSVLPGEPQGAGTSSIDVRLLSLDDLRLPAPTVVKIDVEGAESAVLRGMLRILSEQQPLLIIEIHGDQREPVESILREVDYRSRELIDEGMPHLLASSRSVLARSPSP